MRQIIRFIITLMLAYGSISAPVTAKSCMPVSAPSGPYDVVVDTFSSLEWNTTFYLFRPEPDTVSPTLLFCPALNVEGPHDIEELIGYFVKQGYHFLFVPARRMSLTRNKLRTYDLGIGGIGAAVKRWRLLDTTRIGIIGHGFGGGAVPALMRALRMRKWGQRGAFMYIMSPWYLYSIDERSMAAFPGGVNLVVQTFDDDWLNDPKIAADIFSIISVPPGRKLFFTTRGITTDTCRIRADFTLPLGDRSVLDKWNALDLYCVCRPIEAAARASFSSDSTSFAEAVKRSVLSGGGFPLFPEPILIPVDTPANHLPRGTWINQWNSPRNPRIDANIIRKARKTHYRGKFKKIGQLTRHVAKTTRAAVKDDEPGDGEESANPIDSGFGADGPFAAREERFAQPLNTTDTVSVFFPDSMSGAFPVIFFLHGYNNGKTLYFSHFIDHIVGIGYALVFSPYPTFPTVDDEKAVMEKYDIAYAGFDAAVKRYAGRLDTSRIGIFGQSFGAGAVPWVAKRLITERGMGSKGSFLFISAPWYLFGVTTEDLRAIPRSVKLLISVYNDDVLNDHQMAVDLFSTVAIPATEKCYMTMYSDTLDSIIMPANHFVTYGSQSIYGVIDNFDFYGIFRHFDALAAYTFTGDTTAKRIALGTGSRDQCYLGEWPDGTPVTPLSVSAQPKAMHPSLQYMFSWDNRLNPRRGTLQVPFKRRRSNEGKR